MPVCPQCRTQVFVPCIAANDNAPSAGPLFVASDDELRCIKAHHTLAIWTKGLGVSRYRVLHRLAELIFGFEGDIYWRAGVPFARPDTLIDDVFGQEPSCSWPGALMRMAEAPPKQRPQDRVLPRLRLVHLAKQIDARGGNALCAANTPLPPSP